MEENVQRIFSILVAIMIFFLLPMYMAFEKKDDISYALALKITSNFVDNVQNKGYISRKMYDKFVDELAVTDNIYKISMEHVAKRYNPVIYIYENYDSSKLLKKLDYNTYKDSYITFMQTGKFRYNGVDYINITLSYDVEEITYNEKQILDVLDRTADNPNNKLRIMKDYDGYINMNYTDIPSITNMYGTIDNSIYTMSVGDEFGIIIKNQNVTIASVLFNTFTLGMNDKSKAKIYINYGATILNESYK
jgi:hypothetical protein